MAEPLPRARGFERAAIAFVVVCVVVLYVVALTGITKPAAPVAAPPEAGGWAPEWRAADGWRVVLPALAAVRPGLGARAALDAIRRGDRRPPMLRPTGSSQKLADLFHTLGYQLDAVRSHGRVPPLFLASLPRDIVALRRADERKAVFLKATLPLVLLVNEQILAERARLEALLARRAEALVLEAADAAWLDRLARRYGLEHSDPAALLARVDVVPASLALAQAAEESGWGTSRFARDGNALFGQRTYDGAGLVPARRRNGETHRVRAFDHLIEGVAAYAFNLNTHPAYEEFRAMRAAARAAGAALDGYRLAAALVGYSERRDAYVAALRAIIRVNALQTLDDARLHDRLAPPRLARGPAA